MSEHIAIKNLEALNQEELFKRVSDICATVNSVSTAKELLEVSLQQTMQLFGAQRGSIFMLDKNGTDLVLKAAEGMNLGERANLVKRMGEGVVGAVANDKKPIIVDDIDQDKRFQNFPTTHHKGYKTRSFICAPLLFKDTLLGVINITDKEGGSHFKKTELQLLDFLSSQIGLNYRRIQLYQKFKSVIKESQDLKNQLGLSSKEANQLKQQVVIHEKLASIGKLAGGIAHEFNNPLDGVMRYTNLSLELVRDNDVVRGYLLEIKQGLNRMANIVRSLLACSRNTTPTMQKIDPHQCIDQVIQSLKMDIMRKEIKIDKHLASNPPELIDLGLERIIFNLVRNAIDAIEKNGHIEITTDFDKNNFEIRVKDNGCGIPSDKLDRIFEPFFTTKDIDKGCGLGLTIVHEIVKTYGGQIQVHSVVKEGTTFTVILPKGQQRES